MLEEISLKQSYRTSRDELLKAFYVPCLSEATAYSRAVGYFTSHILSAAAAGLEPFIERGGRMRLVASPMLDKADADAISEGYTARNVGLVETSIAESLLRELRVDIPDVERERLGFLAWMIAESLLDIKIALVSTNSGLGIYHEKVGVFSDDLGGRVAFSGSANESVGGMVSNFESIEVFRSWIQEDTGRLEEKEEDFRNLWSNATSGLRIYDFPEAAKAELLRFRPPHQPGHGPAIAGSVAALWPARVVKASIPDGVSIRRYQWEAIQSWLISDGRGIWRMATGTGKTITALTLIQRLVDRAEEGPWLIVVVCPFRHLVDQWFREALRFGMAAVRCYESRDRWAEDLSDAMAACRSEAVPFALAVTTNATFTSNYFVEQIASWRSGNFLLVGDEVHNLGSEAFRSCLPSNATHRLGLSQRRSVGLMTKARLLSSSISDLCASASGWRRRSGLGPFVPTTTSLSWFH